MIRVSDEKLSDIIALHYQVPNFHYCRVCRDYLDDVVPWPCQQYLILTELQQMRNRSHTIEEVISVLDTAAHAISGKPDREQASILDEAVWKVLPVLKAMVS